MILETKVGLDVYSSYDNVRLTENVQMRQNIWTQTTSPTHYPLGACHSTQIIMLMLWSCHFQAFVVVIFHVYSI